MIRMWKLMAAGLLAGAVSVVPASARNPSSDGNQPRVHQVSPSQDGDLVVGLCDGETELEVEGVKAGAPMDRQQAQQVAGALMAQWRRKNPRARWDTPRPQPRPRTRKLAQNKGAPSTVRVEGESAESGARQIQGQKANVQSGHTYGNFSARDEQIWRTSTQQFIDRGHKVFHDVKELGGTTGISCDMCHPDASNTHPETYPKYQVQLGRVALLRDMINWCLENPVRGKPFADDDERMRAMEAYIYSKRTGVQLEFGKH